MKSMIVLSLFIASSMSQLVTYAPAYGYSAFGARTALDVFAPTLHRPTIFYSNPGYTYGNLYSNIAAPAPVVASPAAVVTTKSNLEETDEATVVAEVEAPFHLRAIFPVFVSDLRAGSDSEEVIFLRPDQVAPVQPVTDVELEDEPEESDAPSVIVPNFSFRSAPALVTPDLSFRSAPVVHPHFNLPYAALPYPSLLKPAEVKTE